MQLVKAGRIVDDRFTRIADDEPLPEGDALVSAERLLAGHAELVSRAASVGVLWPNNRAVSELVPYLPRLELIALAFPSFRDGRAFSQARKLREQHGYREELRAIGDVLRDQILFMMRSGFDAFEVKKPADVPAFVDASPRYTVFYQPAGDRRASALRRRAEGGHPPGRSEQGGPVAALAAELHTTAAGRRSA
jgi:uncharacterized protein (DUF934 family)